MNAQIEENYLKRLNSKRNWENKCKVIDGLDEYEVWGTSARCAYEKSDWIFKTKSPLNRRIRRIFRFEAHTEEYKMVEKKQPEY